MLDAGVMEWWSKYNCGVKIRELTILEFRRQWET